MDRRIGNGCKFSRRGCWWIMDGIGFDRSWNTDMEEEDIELSAIERNEING